MIDIKKLIEDIENNVNGLTERQIRQIVDVLEMQPKDKHKTTTNADRIRNFSDKELAEFLLEVNSTIQHCMIMDCKYEDEREGLCKNCFLEWLQAEVKEGEQHECS